jgi:hypothetical protein
MTNITKRFCAATGKIGDLGLSLFCGAINILLV